MPTAISGPPPGSPWLTIAACLAVVSPAVLAVNLPPSATFLNQAAAVSGWGLFCAVLAWSLVPGPSAPSMRWGVGLRALLAAVALLMAACAGSWMMTGLPSSLTLSAIGMLAGYCGTLLTPMAANFNIVPAALLELPDQYAVIRAQVWTALPLSACNVLLLLIVT